MLEAALVAAAAHTGLVGVHAHVADLAARTERAVDHIAVHHDATAQTGADRHHDHAAMTLGATTPQLPHGSRVRIVHVAHGGMGTARLECLLELGGVDLDVGGKRDVAARGNGARQRQTDAAHEQHGLLHGRHELLDAAHDRRVALLIGQRGGWHAHLAE